MFYIPFVLILAASVNGIGQPHYECGENGRFEYCIDDIPGCIVGCHCHPGYYFDTETKICEPNSKMVLEFRRQFPGPPPTRVPDLILPMNEQDLEPTPTTTSAVNTADMTAKESDDLGDWLYNQFFKTIESQVINGTNSTDNPKPETRRSYRGTSIKRKRQKSSKSKKSKRKRKELRRKMLRITEDDSLFDESSSGTSSSDDSSYSSSGSSSDSSSDTSSSEGEKKGDHDHKDGEHGHRKILVVNKKKKPPLPSFIFLPNMGTPFFPPIGLAPPMPMYPMVPVPPMPVPPPPFMPPPFQQVTPCSSNGSDSDATQKPEANEKEPVSSAAETTTTATTLDPGGLRKPQINKLKKRAKNTKQLRHLQQLKLLRKQAEATSDLDNFESPVIPDDPVNAIPDALPAAQPPTGAPKADEPPPENVDFKYLAQLIHKMDIDNTTVQTPKTDEKPTMPSRRYGSNPLDNYYQPPPPIENLMNTHRNFENNRHLETPDESYYMNLGHQIASLIRKIDATGEQRFNIEVERHRTSPPPLRGYQAFDRPPIVLDRGYTPRSYWERSVRSLLEHLQPNNEYNSQNSREDSLFNLEQRVETIATTTRSLSLNDLENVVYWMDKVKSKYRKTTKTLETTTIKNDDNLNVNLLPHIYERAKHEHKNYEHGSGRPLPAQFNQIKNKPQIIINNKPQKINKNNDSDSFKHNMIDKNNNLRGVIIQNFQPASRVNFEHNHKFIKYPNELDTKDVPSLKLKLFLASLAEKFLKSAETVEEPKIHQNSTNQITNIVKKLNHTNKRTSRPTLDNSDKLSRILSSADIYRKQLARKPMTMMIMPRKQNKQLYVDKSNNRYLHHESMPMPLYARAHPPPRRYGNPAAYSRPLTYFHHELQHFDFFK